MAKAPKESGEPQPASLLRPDRRNARRISKEKLSGLKFSMHEFGDLSGIVWNEKLGDLVGGHQRMRVLGAAGALTWTRLSPTEGVIVHPKTGERFRIRIVNWDEEKHRQAQLVANSPQVQGEFTEEAQQQLRELEDTLYYEALRLDELHAELVGEIDTEGEEAGEGEGGEEGAGDESSKLTDAFMVIIEARDEEQQRELLERFAAEGLRCRALT